MTSILTPNNPDQPSVSLLPIIVQRPVTKKKITECPLCGGTHFKCIESYSTLLGCSGNEDPNHYTHVNRCDDCGKKFVVNTKYDNIWVTDYDGHVLYGVSNCFETVIYTCSSCGGDVVKSHLTLDGRVMGSHEGLSSSLVDGQIYSDYQTKWECVVCLLSVAKRGNFPS